MMGRADCFPYANVEADCLCLTALPDDRLLAFTLTSPGGKLAFAEGSP